MKLNTQRKALTATVWGTTFLGAVAVSSPSQALEYEKGDWLFNVDTTLGYSAQWRTENRDDVLEANANGNDGNNNFDDGDMTSSKANIILEVGGEKDNFSFFVRADALYDYIYEDGDSSMSKENYLTYNAGIPRGGDVDRGDFPDDTLDEHGTRVRLLDAFVQYSFDVGEQGGSIKAGRQIITWGGSTFYPGISGLQNPADGAVAAAPGVEAKEIFLPTNAIDLKWDFNDSVSAEAYYKLEWKETTQPGVGSFLSTTDLTGPGAERILLDPLPVDGKAGGSDKPDDEGQWGTAFRYMTDAGWTAEFAYAEAHANIPGALTVIDFSDFSRSFIEEVYEDDIPSWSFTVTGNISEAVVYADIYYSDDMPFVDLTPQIGPGTFIQSDVTRDDYWQVTVGMNDVYTRFKWLSEQIDFRLEAIYQWNDLGEGNLEDTPYTVTEDAWGYQATLSPLYYNVIQGLDVIVTLAFRHDVDGYGNAIALGNGLEEDQKRGSFSVTGNYLTNWQFKATYAAYFDEKEDGEYGLKDRDNFSVSVKYRF
jgi:hypothetical protein